jgi:hypothetical protein
MAIVCVMPKIMVSIVNCLFVNKIVMLMVYAKRICNVIVIQDGTGKLAKLELLILNGEEFFLIILLFALMEELVIIVKLKTVLTNVIMENAQIRFVNAIMVGLELSVRFNRVQMNVHIMVNVRKVYVFANKDIEEKIVLSE